MFINDLPRRERAEQTIGEVAAALSQRLEKGEVSAREMIVACRQILDLWIDGGGSSLDDEVVGLLGIESQCDHVMLRPGQREPRNPEYDDEDAEIEQLGSFFREGFTREMRDLTRRFNVR
jgi:hypothetical protein